MVAVVVTYNRLPQLQQTLDHLLSVPEPALSRIVVVDNASGADTADYLAMLPRDRVDVLTLPDNMGGAGGFEAGLRYAHSELNPEWCVVMDDDAYPAPGALEAFQARPPATGAAAAAVFYPDGTICEMNRPSRNPFWQASRFVRTLFGGGRRGFHLADADFAPEAPVQPIDVASFVGFFLRRDAMVQAGYPDGRLFIYGDDVLYSLTARRAGVQMSFLPHVRFTHDCGTMGQGMIYRPLWKIYYHCRNGVGIAYAAAGPLIFPAALAYYTVLWWRRGRGYPPAERRVYNRLMWRGLRDGLLRRKGRNDAVHVEG